MALLPPGTGGNGTGYRRRRRAAPRTIVTIAATSRRISVRRHVRCADCRCDRAGNVRVGARETSGSVRRSCRNVESAYLTLVACRRVEASHAGSS